MEDPSLGKVDQTSNMKQSFDRSAALRRVWLMMDSPRCKIVKKKPQNNDNPNGGGAAQTRKRKSKAAGVTGQYPRTRKHAQRPACEEPPRVPFCKHFSETEEERSERLAGYMERYRRATQNESPEVRQKRLERLEEEKKAKRAMPYTGRIRSNRYAHETEEQRQKRLARYAKYNRMRLENETAEKRERRLEFSKIATKRSYEHKLLKEKLMKESNRGDPSIPTTSLDTTTMDLVKGIEESQSHLRYAKVVTKRRRIVAEAIDKEHLEEMLAIAEESLLMNVKKETGSEKFGENSYETVDNLQRNGNEAPVQNIETENMANGKILSNPMSAPKALMNAVASKALSVQVITEKQDQYIIPGNDSRATSQDVQFLQLKSKPFQPDNVTTLDNSPDIIIVPVINPSVTLNLPLLHNKPENPKHIISMKNSHQVMPMPFSDSQLKSKGLDLATSLQNHHNLVIKPVNNGPTNAQDIPVVPKGPEKQCEASVEQQVIPVPFSNLQKPSNKVLSQRVKTEKLVQLVPTQHSPEIIQVDNLQSIHKGVSLLQNRNGGSDHLFSANAPKIVPVPLMTHEVPLLQIKTEKPNHVSVEVDNHAILSMPEPKIAPKITFVNDLQSVSKRTPVLLSLLNRKPYHTSIGKNVPGYLNVTTNKVPLASVKSVKPDYATIQNHPENLPTPLNTLKKPHNIDIPIPKITSGISEGNMQKRSADVFLPMVNPVNAVVSVINQLTYQDIELEIEIQNATSNVLNLLSNEIQE